MIILVVLSYVIAAAAAAPATYDQRQDGDFNVRADVKNVMLLVALPSTKSWMVNQFLPSGLLETFFVSKSEDGEPTRVPQVQERADRHTMDAFVEPSTPYRVDIGEESSRLVDGETRTVEVVIAGRRRTESEVAAEGDELKLLGATEQCGPERERDPDTLMCRPRAPPAADSAAPEGHDSAAPEGHDDAAPAPQHEVVSAT